VLATEPAGQQGIAQRFSALAQPRHVGDRRVRPLTGVCNIDHVAAADVVCPSSAPMGNIIATLKERLLRQSSEAVTWEKLHLFLC